MINTKTKLKDIYNDPRFFECKDYIIYNRPENFEKGGERTLEELNRDTPGWGDVDMAYGLTRLEEICGEKYLYNVYSPEEIEKCKEKKNVVMFHFPAKEKGGAFALIVPGGGYTSVCTLAEGFPVAAKLNELGITAFVLNYRVNIPALFPRPLEDVAASLKFIAENAEAFGVDANRYYTLGFSAGGHLAALWGTKSQGYGKYGMPKPLLSVLGYPLVSIASMSEKMPLYMKLGVKYMFVGLKNGKEKMRMYSVDNNIDKDYAPCYIAHSKDDNLVPTSQSELLQNACEKAGVPCIIRWQESGGHGFGLATKNELHGWIEDAIEFSRKLENS